MTTHIVPRLVASETPLLSFLRTENYDAIKAAERAPHSVLGQSPRNF